MALPSLKKRGIHGESPEKKEDRKNIILWPRAVTSFEILSKMGSIQASLNIIFLFPSDYL